MEGINNFGLFVIASIMIVAIPGQDFIYVITRGIAEGKKAGVFSALGISVGILVHTIFAVFGLSLVLQASQIAYQVIQYGGALYLVYLGIMMFRSKDALVVNGEPKVNSSRNIFWQGVVTNVFNPKAILVFIAFLPQFISRNVSNPAFQFFVLGLTLCIIAIVWFSFVGYFAGLIGAYVKQNVVVQRVVKYLAGSIFIGLGIRLALQKQS